MNEEEEIEYLEKKNEELRREVLELHEKRESLSAALPSGSSNVAVAISNNTSFSTNGNVLIDTTNGNVFVNTDNGNLLVENTSASNIYTSNVYCPYIPLQYTNNAKK